MRLAGEGIFWGAHATLVPFAATRLKHSAGDSHLRAPAFGESPNGARESRALPR